MPSSDRQHLIRKNSNLTVLCSHEYHHVITPAALEPFPGSCVEDIQHIVKYVRQDLGKAVKGSWIKACFVRQSKLSSPVKEPGNQLTAAKKTVDIQEFNKSTIGRGNEPTQNKKSSFSARRRSI
jgi:hypothetical protein